MRRPFHQPKSRAGHQTAILLRQPPDVAAIFQLRKEPLDEARDHCFHWHREPYVGIHKHAQALLSDRVRVRSRRPPDLSHLFSLSQRPGQAAVGWNLDDLGYSHAEPRTYSPR